MTLVAIDQDGFLKPWHASIPGWPAHVTVPAEGVCTVQLLAEIVLIYANQVFFDRSELLEALAGS